MYFLFEMLFVTNKHFEHHGIDRCHRHTHTQARVPTHTNTTKYMNTKRHELPEYTRRNERPPFRDTTNHMKLASSVHSQRVKRIQRHWCWCSKFFYVIWTQRLLRSSLEVIFCQ